EWIACTPPYWLRQPVEIKRPARGIGSKGDDLPKLRKTRQFLSGGNLPMMSRHRFMIGQRRHTPFWNFIHITQIGEEDTGSGTILGTGIVIRGWRGRFFKLRHATHLAFRFWNAKE